MHASGHEHILSDRYNTQMKASGRPDAFTYSFKQISFAFIFSVAMSRPIGQMPKNFCKN